MDPYRGDILAWLLDRVKFTTLNVLLVYFVAGQPLMVGLSSRQTNLTHFKDQPSIH